MTEPLSALKCNWTERKGKKEDTKSKQGREKKKEDKTHQPTHQEETQEEEEGKSTETKRRRKTDGRKRWRISSDAEGGNDEKDPVKTKSNNGSAHDRLNWNSFLATV